MVERRKKMIITKNAEGYGYKYTDLAQIHRLLEENGLSYQQYIEPHENGNDYIMTVLIDKDGNRSEPIRGCKIVDATLSKVNPVQQYGASLTYCRRYSLLMAYGLATTDDDAESLTVKNPIGEKKAKILAEYIAKVGKEVATICEYYGVDKLEELTEEQYGNAVKKLKRSEEDVRDHI